MNAKIDVTIGNEQVKKFAIAVYRDINTYISEHKHEYDKYIQRLAFIKQCCLRCV